MKRWLEVDGDNTYALDWPLTPESIVVEVGAYKGRWSKQIYQKYGCIVHSFEPQAWAYDELSEASKDTKIRPHAFGLVADSGPQEHIFTMGEYDTDACSLFTAERKTGIGHFYNINQAFEELLINEVDLMMMNIEGYEYELIAHIIDTELIKKIKNLCVQWHTFADEYGDKYAILCGQLESYGFTKLWTFYPTLEGWNRTDG